MNHHAYFTEKILINVMFNWLFKYKQSSNVISRHIFGTEVVHD